MMVRIILLQKSELPAASAPYKSFRLVNNEEGIVQLTIDHELKKGKLATGYSLPLDIHLLNNIGLLSGVDVDLMVEGSVLYYTKAQALLNGKAIDIIDVPSGEDDDEGEDVEEEEEEEEEVSPPVLIQV
jgi:hypothetical protein